MTQKFVIRLLTESGELLAWGEEHLKPIPNRDEGNTRFGGKGHRSMLRVLKAGRAEFISIHWCDLDVARKMPITGGAMEVPNEAVGTDAQFHWMQAIWGVQGNTEVPVPPVTVGAPVVLAPDPAQIGAIST
jgi:hypothetical protein